MTSFKFKIGDEVEVYRILKEGVHHRVNIEKMKCNIGSVLQILDCRHDSANGNIYSLKAIHPGGGVGTWWFAECELRLEKEISSFTKSIINKVFTGRNYD